MTAVRVISHYSGIITANHQPPPLISAPRSVCLHLLPCPMSVRNPFAALSLQPGPCQPMEGLPVVSPSLSLVTPPLPTCVIFWLLASSNVWYRYFWVAALRKGMRPGRLHYLEVTLHPPPPLHVYSGAVQATHTPPPHYSSPIVVLTPPPSDESVGCSACRYQ